MALALRLPPGERLQVTAQPLSPAAFAAFGDVIANPRPGEPAASALAALPPNAAAANQGSAVHYRAVSHPRSLYAQAPSGRADAATSLFVCAARAAPAADRVGVGVLERHPFTTQTFSPLASSAGAYLVVVAPSRPPAGDDDPCGRLPVARGPGLPAGGAPDLGRLRAFVASDRQAVTYAPGTWHAPMVALGCPDSTLDFVVWQFASGVAAEDCQLVEFEPEVDVVIPAAPRLDKL